MKKDIYLELSEALEKLTSYLKEKTKERNKEKFEELLANMKHLSKNIGGNVLEIYTELEKKIYLFFEKKETLKNVMKDCILLKNELWEL